MRTPQEPPPQEFSLPDLSQQDQGEGKLEAGDYGAGSLFSRVFFFLITCCDFLVAVHLQPVCVLTFVSGSVVISESTFRFPSGSKSDH